MSKTLADILRSYIPDGDGYNSEYAHNLNAAADALESQQSAPAGYVMVPIEPTPKMIDATWYHEIDMSCGIESQCARNKRIYEAMLAAAPKAEQPPVQCPAYSERIVPAPTALIQWAWEDEPESTLFDEGYNAARRWVRMQIEYAVSKAPQPSDDARDALVEALEVLAKLGNGEHYGNSDGNVIAQMALAAYRAAMESK